MAKDVTPYKGNVGGEEGVPRNGFANGGLEGVVSNNGLPEGFTPLEDHKMTRFLLGIKRLSAYNRAAESIVQTERTEQLARDNILELEGVYALGRQITKNPELYGMINEQVQFYGENLDEMSPHERIRKIGEIVASFLSLPEQIEIYQKAESKLAIDVAKETSRVRNVNGIADAVGGVEGLEIYKNNTQLMGALAPIDYEHDRHQNKRTFNNITNKIEHPIVSAGAVASGVVAAPIKSGFMGLSHFFNTIGEVYQEYPVEAWGATFGEAGYIALVATDSPLIDKILGSDPSTWMYIAAGAGAAVGGMAITTIVYHTLKGIAERRSEEEMRESAASHKKSAGSKAGARQRSH